MNAIVIGRDGIIIQDKKGFGGALFLPQVPVEWKWTKEQYLSRLCEKAGLPNHVWKDVHITKLMKFQGEIFSETSPNGDVVRKVDIIYFKIASANKSAMLTCANGFFRVSVPIISSAPASIIRVIAS